MVDEEAAIRLTLVNELAVQMGLERTALSVRGLTMALLENQAAMKTTHRRSFLMNQVLFTMRRGLYAATLATVAFSAAAVTMGFKFNMAMENNRVAMTQFLGSVGAANKELDYLYDVAAKTPFEFSQVTDAARRFLAFGFSVQQTNRYLAILGDTAAAFGGQADTIQRLVLVFGQMRAAGRVLGQDLLQLEQVGVPALQILQDQLGLTQDQMANIGRLHIPADIAIEALMRGLNQRFKGMAEEQAKTLQGRLSTLHDYAAQLFGTLTLPLYNRIRDVALPQLTDLAQQMNAAAKRGGIVAALGVVDQRYGTDLVGYFNRLNRVVKASVSIFKEDFLPMLKIMLQMLSPIKPLLGGLATVLEFFARHSLLAKIALGVLVIELARARLALILLGGPLGNGGLLGSIGRAIGLGKDGPGAGSIIGRFNAWGKIIKVTRTGAVQAWGFMAYHFSLLTRGYVKGAKEVIIHSGRMDRAMLALRRGILATRDAFIGLTAAELGWIGVALLVIGLLVYLYFRWKRFHDIVNSTAKFLWKHYYIFWLLIGAFGIAIPVTITVIKNWGRLVGLIKILVHWVKMLVHWLGKVHFPGIPGWAKGAFHAATGAAGSAWSFVKPRYGFATGGFMPTTGAALVGEHGPEVVNMPGGTQVTPVSSTNFPVQSVSQDRPLEVYVYLDGKQISKSNAKHTANARARR